MELMEKVKQVGESYELNKLKTQNRTIELDARLASERLFATKVRLHQVNNDNEKLSKQLRLSQQHMRELEKKLLLAETMLRQFVDKGSQMMAGAQLDGTGQADHHHNGNNNVSNNGHSANLNAAQPTGGGRSALAFTRAGGRLTGASARSGGRKLKAPAGRQQQQKQQQQQQQPHQQGHRLVRFDGNDAGSAGRRAAAFAADNELAGGQAGGQLNSKDDDRGGQSGRPVVFVSAAAEGGGQPVGGQSSAAVAGSGLRQLDEPGQTAAVATQTSLPSRAKTIINDLRQRLNLGSGSNRAPGE
jgi:hypothetical protein